MLSPPSCAVAGWGLGRWEGVGEAKRGGRWEMGVVRGGRWGGEGWGCSC